MLRLHYRPASSPGQLRVETFPLRLADDSWHRLAVTVSGDQIEVSHVSTQRATCLMVTCQVLLDCRPVHRRVVPALDTSFPGPGLTAWLGQRGEGSFLFKVSTGTRHVQATV